VEKIVIRRIVYSYATEAEEHRQRASFVLNNESLFLHLNLLVVYNGHLKLSTLTKFPATYMEGWAREGKANLLQSNWNISPATNYIHSEMTYYTNFID